jgi:hypothetical protein
VSVYKLLICGSNHQGFSINIFIVTGLIFTVVLHNSSGFFQVSKNCNAIRHQCIHRIAECGNIPAAGRIRKESFL